MTFEQKNQSSKFSSHVFINKRNVVFRRQVISNHSNHAKQRANRSEFYLK